ncbi:9167_t:CDS:2 [Gigaspora rosea]|nr:9167_t:CDS:2 [Gigaspora rosea]
MAFEVKKASGLTDNKKRTDERPETKREKATKFKVDFEVVLNIDLLKVNKAIEENVGNT